jgi:type IV pilus assembly protein PilM
MEKIGMLKQFKARYYPLLGVDISPTSVKILEISKHPDKFCVEGYGYEPLPANAFETSPDKAVSAIKRLLTQINSSAKFAAIAVPDSTVISKTIQLVDSLNDLEIEELIFLEADKYLNYPPDKINIDFIVIGPGKKSLGMLDVLLLASREDNIRKRVDILKDAGLETKIVDIESYAIASVFEQLDSEATRCKLIAVFDISYELMRLLVLENGEIIYTRDDTFASQSNEEAILQIKRSLQFFFSASHYDCIEKIYLSGELQEFPELAQKIEQETGFLTCVANPFNQLSLSKNINVMEFTKLAPLFLVALGLALRLAHDN